MKNKLKKIGILFALALAFTEVYAQRDTGLVQSATFEGDLSIFLRDANKISSQPFVIETETNAALLKYNILPTRQISFTQPATILSSSYPVEKKLKKLQQGWIDVSFGSYVTPKVDAYYTDGRSKKGDWGIRYGHQSSNSNFEVLSGAELPTTFSENNATLWGKRFYKKTVADAKLNWNRNVTNWYGLDSSQLSYFPDFSALKQTMNVYSGNIGIRTFDRDSNDLNWWGKAGYRLASDAFSSNEHFVDVSGGASKLVKTEVFSGEFGMTYNQFNSTGLDWSQDYANTWGEGDTLRTVRSFDNAIVRFIPTAYTVFNDLRVKIGMGLYMQSRGEQRGHFYPQAEVSYSILDGMFVPYAGIKGSLAPTTYYGLYNQNPFVVVQPQLLNQNNKMQVYGGISGSISRRVNYSVGGELNKIENFAFFVNDSLFSRGNMQGVLYDDLRVAKAKGEIEVLGGRKWKAKIGGSYSYFETSQQHAWQLPNLQFSAEASYNLNSKFKFNFQGMYYGDRWAKSLLPVTGRDAQLQLDRSYVYKMKGFVDVNLRSTYTYNERLSAYLQFNNILAQKYAIYSGIPSQRFFAAMGASYSF
ncbi:MAG: hypothetical protein RL664_776 [Bacteroidota bacterium]|jgi:hypothetical protein